MWPFTVGATFNCTLLITKKLSILRLAVSMHFIQVKKVKVKKTFTSTVLYSKAQSVPLAQALSFSVGKFRQTKDKHHKYLTTIHFFALSI